MTKVAIKNENITSFGGIYHIMDVCWALKNLPNLYWANVEVAAKHSAMEASWIVKKIGCCLLQMLEGQ